MNYHMMHLRRVAIPLSMRARLGSSSKEVLMSTATHINREIGTMINVRATEDIEFLVKESEVITGWLAR